MNDKESFLQSLAEQVGPELAAFARELQRDIERVDVPLSHEDFAGNYVWTTDVWRGILVLGAVHIPDGSECDFFGVRADGIIVNFYDEDVIDAEPFADMLEQVCGRCTGVTLQDMRDNWEELLEEIEWFYARFVEQTAENRRG